MHFLFTDPYELRRKVIGRKVIWDGSEYEILDITSKFVTFIGPDGRPSWARLDVVHHWLTKFITEDEPERTPAA
jgi:hypothetical protein